MPKPLSILICEPSCAVAETLRQLFLDSHVDIVTTGREAWLRLETQRPDYLLLDMFPEDTDAFDFMSRFHGSIYSKNTRVIVLSPTDPESLFQKLQAFGVAGVVRRSEVSAELLAQLRPLFPADWIPVEHGSGVVLYVGARRAYSKFTEAAAVEHRMTFYSAPTCNDALRLLKYVSPTIIIFDMEECIGQIVALLDMARGVNPSVQFTAITSGVSKGIHDRIIHKGVNKILLKPCSAAAVSSAIAVGIQDKRTPAIPTHAVLVVEDSSDTATAMEALLSQCGLNVTIAGSAERALELLPRYKYSAMLLDLGLPGMDGVELLARVRHSGMRIPCVVVTASYNREDHELLSDLGIEALFEKPADFMKVTQVMSTLLATSQ